MVESRILNHGLYMISEASEQIAEFVIYVYLISPELLGRFGILIDKVDKLKFGSGLVYGTALLLLTLISKFDVGDKRQSYNFMLFCDAKVCQYVQRAYHLAVSTLTRAHVKGNMKYMGQ